MWQPKKWYNASMPTIESHSLEKTKEVAVNFIKNLEPNKTGATVVCLYGDLGSGKTTFVKEAAKALGINEIVTSPTFVIEKIYEVTHPDFDKLVHIDAYRLIEGGELLALGWQELVKNTRNIIFIEWPKYVADVLPKERFNITFTFVDERTRNIDFV